jgi:hypothetical protein
MQVKVVCPFLLDLILPSKELSIESGRLFYCKRDKIFPPFCRNTSHTVLISPDSESAYLPMTNISELYTNPSNLN